MQKETWSQATFVLLHFWMYFSNQIKHSLDYSSVIDVGILDFIHKHNVHQFESDCFCQHPEMTCSYNKRWGILNRTSCCNVELHCFYWHAVSLFCVVYCYTFNVNCITSCEFGFILIYQYCSIAFIELVFCLVNGSGNTLWDTSLFGHIVMYH